jgi:hypothetical protein
MENLATTGMKTSKLLVLNNSGILGELIFFYSGHTFYGQGASQFVTHIIIIVMIQQ